MSHRRAIASSTTALAAACAAFAPFGARGAFAQESAATPARTELVRCEVTFSYDSTRFAADSLDACLRAIDRSELRYFEVFATASPKGETEYNRKLSERRAQALGSHLARAFPGVATSRPLGGGENPQRGATGTVVAVNAALPEDLVALSDDAGAGVPMAISQGHIAPLSRPSAMGGSEAASTAPASAPPDTRVSALGTGNGKGPASTGGPSEAGGGLRSQARDADVRLATRAGIDRMRNGRTWYPAWGAEFSWLPNPSTMPYALPGNVGLELGAQGNALSRNDVLDLYNAYGFAGAKWSFLPEGDASPVAGARLLAGATWHSRGQGTADAGAEVRAGVEGAGYSVLAGIGMTRQYHRFGLDAGLRF